MVIEMYYRGNIIKRLQALPVKIKLYINEKENIINAIEKCLTISIIIIYLYIVSVVVIECACCV